MTAHPRCRRTQPIERVSIRYYPRLGGCCPTINDNCANLLPYSWRWPMIMLSHVRWRTKQIYPLGTFTLAGGGNLFSHITGVHSCSKSDDLIGTRAVLWDFLGRELQPCMTVIVCNPCALLRFLPSASAPSSQIPRLTVALSTSTSTKPNFITILFQLIFPSSISPLPKFLPKSN